MNSQLRQGEILYVDDDTANLSVFETAYSRDLPIAIANSGIAALEILRSRDVAVLLSDQRMPDMTGVDLLEIARQEVPDTVRMLVTAYTDLDAAVEAINRGQAHFYFRKPWQPLELKVALAQAREGYLAKRRLAELERRMLHTERLYSLGVIAAGVAHELRNPLTALSMNLEVIRADLGVPSPVVAGALHDAHFAVQSIGEIVNSVELSTRARADGEIDLAEVVRLSARAVHGEMRKRGRVELDLGVIPPLRGSRTRVGQVVLNLLVNAAEAFDPARRTRNVVKVCLTSSGGVAELRIADNGPGIEPATLARVFDPFFTTKEEGGTGLGLAISRQIVEEMGGTLVVESKEGEGTTFVARWPIPPSATEQNRS